MMKLIFALAVVLLALGQAQAQVTTQDIYDSAAPAAQQAAKQTKKQELAVIDTVHYHSAAQAIADRYFVLLVDNISLDFSPAYEGGLDTQRNFVLVQGENAIVQTASNYPGPGLNNLGGVTLRGRVSGYSTRTNKKGDVTVQFNLVGSHVNATVFVTLLHGGDHATATVNPSLGRGGITMDGRLVPYVRVSK